MCTPENKSPDRANNYHFERYQHSDINGKLIMCLRDLGHAIRFLFEGKGSQKRILSILKESGDMTQRELTERLHIQRGSASEVIKKLEDAGLIRRTPNGSDRRTIDICLTKTGHLQAEEAIKERHIKNQDMFSHLTDEEKETLLVLLEKLEIDWDSRFHYQEHYCRSKKHASPTLQI